MNQDSPTGPIEIQPELRGTGKPFRGRLVDYAAALVQAPGAIVDDVHRSRSTVLKLCALVAATMCITGLVVAAFSGGLQFLVVPIKLAVGMLVCAALCLPSLYIFSSIAGASQNLRETAVALLMGTALIGVLLVGLAPVNWLFSQTTSSPAIIGALHIVSLLVSSVFGMGLVRRVLSAMNGREVPAIRGWAVMFVLVVLQMTTTLRPIVGDYDGQLVGERKFFAAHWVEVAIGSDHARSSEVW